MNSNRFHYKPEVNKIQFKPETHPNRPYKIPKRTLLQRYPKLFFWGSITLSLTVFYSRPLYDIFFRTDFKVPEVPKIEK